ncbi:MAG TPA: type VI secretion system baseplate subunit TssK [Candidatus Angelobacter sp.]|nr:type VI secretion system baseplate subunit TssK [Candidatus Angelobacter sp.]
MKQLQHVLWSKGIFLTPQHLQVQDRYMENLLQFQLEACAFRLWGFASLQIDQNKLLEGHLAVDRASGILPDGLLFDIPAADPTPPSRTVNDFFSEEQTQVAVYLSVPEQRDNGINVGQTQETKTRFVREDRMIRDENSGLAEKPVQIARKNLKLLIEGETLEGNTVMQIAQIEKTRAGTYRLLPAFIPPMIDIHGNDRLAGMAHGLVETLGARSFSLAAGRRQKNQNLAEFTTADIANFWLLYTVNYHLPLFRHLFHRRVVHPEQLFSAMLSLAGALTTFSTSVAPHDLPEYDHERLGGCFSNLEQKIRFLLETVIPTNFVALPLKLVKPSIYATAIENDSYLRNSKLYLAVSADVPDGELISRTPAVMKAGAAGYVDDMIRQALPGIRMTHVPSTPPEIPVKSKYKYFSLELSGKVWEGVQRARNFGVYAPADFPEVKLELIILLPYKQEVAGSQNA